METHLVPIVYTRVAELWMPKAFRDRRLQPRGFESLRISMQNLSLGCKVRTKKCKRSPVHVIISLERFADRDVCHFSRSRRRKRCEQESGSRSLGERWPPAARPQWFNDIIMCLEQLGTLQLAGARRMKSKMTRQSRLTCTAQNIGANKAARDAHCLVNQLSPARHHEFSEGSFGWLGIKGWRECPRVMLAGGGFSAPAIQVEINRSRCHPQRKPLSRVAREWGGLGGVTPLKTEVWKHTHTFIRHAFYPTCPASGCHAVRFCPRTSNRRRMGVTSNSPTKGRVEVVQLNCCYTTINWKYPVLSGPERGFQSDSCIWIYGSSEN